MPMWPLNQVPDSNRYCSIREGDYLIRKVHFVNFNNKSTNCKGNYAIHGNNFNPDTNPLV